jgi:hypothetical protein
MTDDDETESDPSVLGMIKSQIISEGIPANTVEFERRFDQVRVSKCREMRGYSVCGDCEAFDFCELIKHVMRVNRGYDK